MRHRKAATVILGLAALVAASLVGTAHADRQYTLCDPAKSTLCSGLAALYEFNEAASDSIRTSETGSTPLIETFRVNVTQDTSTKKLGAAALRHQAVNGDGLTIPRTAPFGGTFTFGFWLSVDTLPSANGKKVPIFWMAPIYDTSGSEYMINNSSTPDLTTGNLTPYPRVYLYNSNGTTYVRYEVKQSMTETVTYVQSSQSVNASTWYYVALGQYPTPTSTYPYQQTLWVSVSTASLAARATQTITYPDYGQVSHFMLAGLRAATGDWELGAFRMDQFGVWSRYLMDAELGELISSGSGRAYPWY
jgi:hypothetical protein